MLLKAKRQAPGGEAGFSGVALAKALGQRGTEADLAVTDLRAESLEKARRRGAGVLVREVRTEIADARKVHELGERYELVPLYCLSTPPFRPVGTRAAPLLGGRGPRKRGLLRVEGFHRDYRIFLTIGYKWALMKAISEDLSPRKGRRGG